MFDASILDDTAPRAARLVAQHAVDPGLPGLGEVLERLTKATFDALAATLMEEISHVVLGHTPTRIHGVKISSEERARFRLLADNSK